MEYITLCFAILGGAFFIYASFVILDKLKITKLDYDTKINVFLIIFICATIIFILSLINNQKIVAPASSIIGGGLTLIGVWWTINDQNRKRKEDEEKSYNKKKEDLAIQYRPFLLNFKDYTYYRKDIKTFAPLYYKNRENSEIDILTESKVSLRFCTKNIGRGEAIINKIKITPIKIDFADIKIDFSYNEIIMKDMNLVLKIDIIIWELDDIAIGYNAYSIDISYTDLYKQQDYKNNSILYIGVADKQERFCYTCNPENSDFIIKITSK